MWCFEKWVCKIKKVSYFAKIDKKKKKKLAWTDMNVNYNVPKILNFIKAV